MATLKTPAVTVPASAAPSLTLASAAPTATKVVLAITRIAFGFYFLWAFLDKTFGLGFSTPSERAWINGGSPTTGYLSNVDGPFASTFNAIAGNVFVDWLFMVGLLGIGVALVVGAGMRIAAGSAALMLAFMYLASLPLTTNPVLDDHIILGLGILVVTLVGAGDVFGLGRWWRSRALVRKHRWLV